MAGWMEEGRKERNCRKLSRDTKLSWFVKTAEANVEWWVDGLNDEVEREKKGL